MNSEDDLRLGDIDPEDAWDDDDDDEAKIEILDRVIGSLNESFHQGRRDEALRLVSKMTDAGGFAADDVRLREIKDLLEAMHG